MTAGEPGCGVWEGTPCGVSETHSLSRSGRVGRGESEEAGRTEAEHYLLGRGMHVRTGWATPRAPKEDLWLECRAQEDSACWRGGRAPPSSVPCSL